MKAVTLVQLMLLLLISFAAGLDVTSTTKIPDFKVSVIRPYGSASAEQIESILDGIRAILKEQARVADSLGSLSQCGSLATTPKPAETGSEQQCCAEKKLTLGKLDSCTASRNVLQSLVGDRLAALENKLLDAAINGRVEEIKGILNSGVNASAANGYGQTPLHWAAYKGHVSVTRLLLKYGALKEARDNVKQTPLHWAARGESTDAVGTLLEDGADVDALDVNNWTPLHFAAYTNHDDAARLLLDKGANTTLKTNGNQTPLQLAGDKVKKLL